MDVVMESGVAVLCKAVERCAVCLCFVCLFVVYLFVCLYICLFVYLFVCIFVCLFVYVIVSLFVYLFVNLSCVYCAVLLTLVMWVGQQMKPHPPRFWELKL